MQYGNLNIMYFMKTHGGNKDSLPALVTKIILKPLAKSFLHIFHLQGTEVLTCSCNHSLHKKKKLKCIKK